VPSAAIVVGLSFMRLLHARPGRNADGRTAQHSWCVNEVHARPGYTAVSAQRNANFISSARTYQNKLSG